MKIVFFYTGGHEAHMKMASKITNKIVKLSIKNLILFRNYDILFIEGAFILPMLLKKIRIINKKARLIILFSDPRLYYLNKGLEFNVSRNKIRKYNPLKLRLARAMIKEIDAAICTSKFEAELLRSLNKKARIRIVNPFVSKGRYNKLKKLKPNLGSKNIIFIANGPDYYYKGLDLLIKSFSKVKNLFPDLKLYILGKWKVKKKWKMKGVYFEGQRKIIPYLEKQSLCVHLGRGEAFGVSVLECMLAGIPVIVSNKTGIKEIIEKVRKSFIVDLNEKEIIKKIKEYFKLTLKQKKYLSNRFRKEAERFDEDKSLEEFKQQFKNLIEKYR